MNSFIAAIRDWLAHFLPNERVGKPVLGNAMHALSTAGIFIVEWSNNTNYSINKS